MPKRSTLGLAIFLFCAMVHGQGSQTARDYFNELYKAGGLDEFAAQYVCFHDERSDNRFFLMSDSRIFKGDAQMNGYWKDLPTEERKRLERGYLFLRKYERGLPISDGNIYLRDGDSWAGATTVIEGRGNGRLRLNINWQTLRFAESLEWLDASGKVRSSGGVQYGRCEKVPGSMLQHGAPENYKK